MTVHDPIRVLCVDDNGLILDALARQVAGQTDMLFVGGLPTAETLVSEVAAKHPDVVLLDMNMPGPDPVAAIAELQRAHPEVRVLALSGYVRADIVDRVTAAGGMGYLSKGEPPTFIMNAVRRAVAGEFVLSPEVIEHYARLPDSRPD